VRERERAREGTGGKGRERERERARERKGGRGRERERASEKERDGPSRLIAARLLSSLTIYEPRFLPQMAAQTAER